MGEKREIQFLVKFSIVNLSEIRADNDLFRIDAGYWRPDFIANSRLISREKKIRDFVCAEIANIKSSPIDRDFEYLEISKISMSACAYETTTIAVGSKPDRAHYILKRGDIAVSTVRPNRNAIAFVEKDGIVGSSGLSILRAAGIQPEYLFVFCKTRYFVNCLVRANKATMYPAVSNEDVLNTPLLVASDRFRSCIAEVFQNSFACLKEAKKQYVGGENVLLSELGLADWQPKHQISFAKNYSDTESAGRIDADYFQPKYEKISNAIKSCKGGWDVLSNLVTIQKSVEVGSAEYLDAGIPFVRVSNLNPFEITEEKYISKELYAEIKQHQPNMGEILLSKDGTPGIAHYLHEQPKKMIPSGGILRLKSKKTGKVNGEYLALVLNSVLTKEQVERDVGGSVILHWRPEQVKNLLIPILPKGKQTAIQEKIVKSSGLRARSKHLLNCAKTAVELAMEKDEKAAMRWLKDNAGKTPA
ncbi:MAG: restriction endonuclease subunit S [Alphaproteobacteria bacterium]|nr:restriction endonuclease subunit S [Alphaproteobacteria bacterium]MDA8030083.1 restriction endonuclease subunit S [Alphaproteobacteria bacterium]